VFETEKAIVVRVELGGVRGQDVKVTVDGDTVHVRGVRRPPAGSEIVRPHRMEIAFGPFERTVRVGIPFERDGVVASLEDGFLTVVLPRREQTPRRIELQTGSSGED
jgi:HSP20 family protein